MPDALDGELDQRQETAGWIRGRRRRAGSEAGDGELDQRQEMAGWTMRGREIEGGGWLGDVRMRDKRRAG